MLPEPGREPRRLRKTRRRRPPPPGLEGKSGEEILAAITVHFLQGNTDNFDIVGQYIRRSFQTTYWMNVALFAVGIVSFGAAAVKGFAADTAAQAVPSAVFGGL